MKVVNIRSMIWVLSVIGIMSGAHAAQDVVSSGSLAVAPEELSQSERAAQASAENATDGAQLINMRVLPQDAHQIVEPNIQNAPEVQESKQEISAEKKAPRAGRRIRRRQARRKKKKVQVDENVQKQNQPQEYMMPVVEGRQVDTVRDMQMVGQQVPAMGTSQITETGDERIVIRPMVLEGQSISQVASKNGARMQRYKNKQDQLQELTMQLQRILLINPAEQDNKGLFIRSDAENRDLAGVLQNLTQQLQQAGFNLNRASIDEKIREFNAEQGTANYTARYFVSQAEQWKKAYEQQAQQMESANVMMTEQQRKIQSLEAYTAQLAADCNRKIYELQEQFKQAQIMNNALQTQLQEAVNAKAIAEQQMAVHAQALAQALVQAQVLAQAAAAGQAAVQPSQPMPIEQGQGAPEQAGQASETEPAAKPEVTVSVTEQQEPAVTPSGQSAPEGEKEQVQSEGQAAEQATEQALLQEQKQDAAQEVGPEQQAQEPMAEQTQEVKQEEKQESDGKTQEPDAAITQGDVDQTAEQAPAQEQTGAQEPVSEDVVAEKAEDVAMLLTPDWHRNTIAALIK